MASPAKDARLKAAEAGFTEIISRRNNSITARNPSNNKNMIIAQVGGGWHYNGDQETDTAWETAIAPWNYKIEKAPYNLFALSNFKSGQILKWVDPITGESVTFQPQAFKYTNSINQIQVISQPQDTIAIVDGDKITWEGAYGAGRDYSYIAGPIRMQKLLKVADPLPSTTYDILELEFIMSPSAGVEIVVDGVVWDKKTKKDTSQEVQFRLPGGDILWSFTIPVIFDSAGNESTGILRLRKSGNSLFASVRFSKSWLDSATYPIYIDPTIELQTDETADDGYFVSGTGTSFSNSSALLYSGSNPAMYFFAYFSAVTIPDGAIIDSAYISVYGNSNNGTVYRDIYAEDAANPSVISSAADGRGRTKTSAFVAFDTYSAGWQDTNSIISIIEELMEYSYAAGAPIQIIVTSENSSAYATWKSYNSSGNIYGPKITIIYSTGEPPATNIKAITNHYRQQGAM